MKSVVTCSKTLSNMRRRLAIQPQHSWDVKQGKASLIYGVKTGKSVSLQYGVRIYTAGSEARRYQTVSPKKGDMPFWYFDSKKQELGISFGSVDFMLPRTDSMNCSAPDACVSRLLH